MNQKKIVIKHFYYFSTDGCDKGPKVKINKICFNFVFYLQWPMTD